MHDPAPDYTADVLLLDTAGDQEAPPTQPGEAAPAARERVGYERCRAGRVAQRPLALGPLDETVLNPVGFTRRPTVPVADLRPVPASRTCCRSAPGAPEIVVDTRAGLGDATVDAGCAPAPACT